MSCEVIWLAWLQLPYGAVVLNVLASNVALLVALPALSASRILSKRYVSLEYALRLYESTGTCFHLVKRHMLLKGLVLSLNRTI
jgi:hypothetical protein